MLKIKQHIKLLVAALGALLAGLIVTITVSINNQAAEVKIEFSSNGQKAVVETNGVEEVDIPTVESIDTTKEQTDKVEHGQGAWLDTSSPEAFKNMTLGNAYDFDGYYGAQCWDLVAEFGSNYAGRAFSTCGTGAASGMMNCTAQNAGNEYVVIWNANDIQPGDILVFGFGQYGHTGMAMSYPHNGYVTLLGQNQGGTPYPSGGSSTNLINISLNGFLGAYRPKKYIKPAPKPAPVPAPAPVVKKDVMPSCPVGTKITLKKGDTLGQIMLNCTGEVKWGVDMNNYATTWKSTKVKPEQIVLTGWKSPAGVGLWAGDVIERIK